MKLLPTLLALAALIGGATAQTVGELKRKIDEIHADYGARLRELESRTNNQATTDQDPVRQANQGRRGVGALGQTTIFDSIFNPAVSVIGDFVVAASDRPDSYETLNRFVLRDVEVGLVGRVDPLVSYQIYFHFDEEDIEIEEAYVLADDWLPGTFMLKAGRYNIDFGKLAPLHDHDLPFLDKPQVLQEYLGGALRGTGAELHHYFDIGDATLWRWSAGVVNSLDGDSHPIFGPAAGHHHEGEEGPEPFGRRNFDNFAFTARTSVLTELGDQTTLQIGTSVAAAPEANAFFTQGTQTIQAELQKVVFGADVTVKNLDETTGRGYSIGAEFLRSDAEVSDDGTSIMSVEANGYYAYGMYIASPRWSFGASGGFFEHAEDASEESWDTGLFVSHNVNEFNRIRLEGRHFDDPGIANSWGLTVQWTVILGSHGHGIDW